jgi:hypothetical protein
MLPARIAAGQARTEQPPPLVAGQQLLLEEVER